MVNLVLIFCFRLRSLTPPNYLGFENIFCKYLNRIGYILGPYWNLRHHNLGCQGQCLSWLKYYNSCLAAGDTHWIDEDQPHTTINTTIIPTDEKMGEKISEEYTQLQNCYLTATLQLPQHTKTGSKCLFIFQSVITENILQGVICRC